MPPNSDSLKLFIPPNSKFFIVVNKHHKPETKVTTQHVRRHLIEDHILSNYSQCFMLKTQFVVAYFYYSHQLHVRNTGRQLVRVQTNIWNKT